jgi:hypothetical protein
MAGVFTTIVDVRREIPLSASSRPWTAADAL